MNTHKKTVITLAIALLTFGACQATPEFDKAKSQLDVAFKALFDPAPNKFAYVTFYKDAQANTKIDNFVNAIKNIEQFVKTNNKGLIFGASDTLNQANQILVQEAAKLISTLKEIKKRLVATTGSNLASGSFDSYTEAARFSVDFDNVRNKTRDIRNILRPKMDDYKSTGQKESYALLMDALQTVYDAAAIAHHYLGPWRKSGK